MTRQLAQIVADVPHLRAVFITVMPDCLLFDSWVRGDTAWSADQVASYFGDMIRANREGLKALDAWSADIQLTVEAPEHLIVLKELAHDFVCTCVFDQQAALGMVRLHTKRIHERVEVILPKFEVEERPRAVRIVDFLHRYAPDPHAVMLRVALRTGLDRSLLEQPHALAPEQVSSVEEAACNILGLRELNL
ncbi:MAG: hypothetical protein MI919_30905 [Holophagales bacterium]|nr:hypothetical protein [Holophagales bacterium]